MARRTDRAAPVLRILPRGGSWSWSRRAKIAFAAFGAVWLLLEPRFAFSPVQIERPLVAYALIVFSAVAVTVLAELAARQRRLGVAKKLRLTIILTKSGTRVAVETSPDLTVRDFVDAFLHDVVRDAGLSCYHPQVVSLYENNLLVQRGGEFVAVDADKTLKEAGVRQGSVCKIGGYVRVEYMFATLHVDDAKARAEIREARERGEVFLDEDSAAPAQELAGGPGTNAQMWIVDNIGDAAGAPGLAQVSDALRRAGYTAGEG
ncbi:MAG: hypothetical protein ACLGH0_03725 [Thermoanaerobaculia bacterium]